MRTLVLIACLSLLPACAYHNTTYPLDTNVHDTDLGDKMGRASSHDYLGVVFVGDRGTRAAAEDGGITTITHIDQQYLAILWFVYRRVTTIVYGY